MPDGESTTRRKTRIVVVGGGAGGLELVTKLGATLDHKNFDIILVERNRTHIWKPLLHEVATGSLDASLDEVGYRSHGYRWGYRFFYGMMEGLEREERHVVIAPILDEDGNEIVGRNRIPYDYLVLAVGSVSNDFGTPGVKENCLFLDSRLQADRFRQKLLDHCLRASRLAGANPATDEAVRVAVVGGGATGVELAAELYNAAAELRHYGLEDFDESRLRVTLIEAGPRILPLLPEQLAAAAQGDLEDIGVRVLTGTQVVEVTREAVITAGGEAIPADIRVWAAGVKAPDFLRDIGGLETARNGQLVVRPTLQTTRDDRIFAIGDCCYFLAEGESAAVPPRAQAAHQMANIVAANIRRQAAGKALLSFHYQDHGSLVSLSRYSTVGSLMGNLVGGRMAIEGWLARLVYLSLYRMHLLAIHGIFKGIVMVIVSRINHVIRPRLKLH